MLHPGLVSLRLVSPLHPLCGVSPQVNWSACIFKYTLLFARSCAWVFPWALPAFLWPGQDHFSVKVTCILLLCWISNPVSWFLNHVCLLCPSVLWEECWALTVFCILHLLGDIRYRSFSTDVSFPSVHFNAPPYHQRCRRTERCIQARWSLPSLVWRKQHPWVSSKNVHSFPLGLSPL